MSVRSATQVLCASLLMLASHHACAGTIFGLLSDGSVYEMDPATNAAPIRRVVLPNVGVGYQGMEVVPGTNKMFAVTYARNLVEVNTQTWAVRSLGMLAFPSNDFSAFTKDLSWNPSTQSLETVCVTNNQPSIYRVDTTTLRLTRIGVVAGINGISWGLAHDQVGRRSITPMQAPNKLFDLTPAANGFTAVPRSGTMSGSDFRGLYNDYRGSGTLYSSTANGLVRIDASGTTTQVRSLPFGVPLEDITSVPAPASLLPAALLFIRLRRRASSSSGTP